MASEQECEDIECNARATIACADCKVAVYCSEECRESDWKDFHHDDCQALQTFIAENGGLQRVGVVVTGTIAAVAATAAVVGVAGVAGGATVAVLGKFRRRRAKKNLEGAIEDYESLFDENKRLRIAKGMPTVTFPVFDYDEKTSRRKLKKLTKDVRRAVRFLKAQNKTLE